MMLKLNEGAGFEGGGLGLSSEERRQLLSKLLAERDAEEENITSSSPPRSFGSKYNSNHLDVLSAGDAGAGLIIDNSLEYNMINDEISNNKNNSKNNNNDININSNDSNNNNYNSSNNNNVGGGGEEEYDVIHNIDNNSNLNSFIGIASGNPDDSIIDARAHRIAYQESIIRQEMFKEYTFRPQIKMLPSSYGAQNNLTPFLQRVSKWQKDKDIYIQKKRGNHSEQELEGCTFQPKINSMSIRSAKLQRGDSKESTNERLFKQAEVSASLKQKVAEDEIKIEKEKEVIDCPFKPQRLTKGKFKNIESRFEKIKEKSPVDANNQSVPEKVLKECTFTPKVKGVASNMSSAKMYVSANVVDRLSRPPSVPNTPLRTGNAAAIATRYSRDDIDVSKKNKVGTIIQQSSTSPGFNTSVGGETIDTSSLIGALSAAADNNNTNNNNDDNNNNNDNNSNDSNNEDKCSNEDDTINNASFIDQVAAKPNTEVRSLKAAAAVGSSSQFETPKAVRARPKSAPRERSDINSKGVVEDVNETAALKTAESSENFSQFMVSQMQYVIKKEQRMNKVIQSVTPGFKPKLESKLDNAKINESSIQQPNESGGVRGEFLDRVERDVLRRQENEKKLILQADAEHSFKPQLTKKVAALPASTTYELSTGCSLKKESHRRMIQLQLEKETMANATFKPTITNLAKKTNSKLALKEDPSKFLVVYKEKQEKFEEKQQEELERRTKAELEACTFAPKTVDCPQYIKRIAKSMSVVRQAKLNTTITTNVSKSGMQEIEKPDWR